ncbi:MAG: hypothetical protein HN396_12760 [Gemmatimonadales bacterium]|nr:hypothetical protein [Gemmatimonadales bacterium]
MLDMPPGIAEEPPQLESATNAAVRPSGLARTQVRAAFAQKVGSGVGKFGLIV